VLFEPKANANSPLNAGTMGQEPTFRAIEVREAYRESENSGTCNLAQIMRPLQVWQNNYINNVTRADSPSDVEEVPAPSSPRIAQSIEADDACNLARGTLERAAEAAL